MASVLQEWLETLGLRHQGVVLSAIRGCDTLPKHHPVKTLTRAFRADTLVSFSKNPSSFFKALSHEEFFDLVPEVLVAFDELPYHYVMHMAHAGEILAYHHPDIQRASCWRLFYFQLCRRMHLNPETKAQLDERLNAPEEEFALEQGGR